MGQIPNLYRDKVTTPKIHHLAAQHLSMARMMISGLMRPKDIAAYFGYSPTQISVITNSPIFKAELTRLENQMEEATIDTAKSMQNLTPRALANLAETIGEEAEGLPERKHRDDISIQILNRTGFSPSAPPQKVAHLHAHLHQEVRNMDRKDIDREITEMIEEDEAG